MTKAVPSRRRQRRRRNSHARISSGRKAAIAATLEGIDQLRPLTPKAARVLSLLKAWLKDDSGYDERTWPKLKSALNEERDRVGAPRLFDD